MIKNAGCVFMPIIKMCIFLIYIYIGTHININNSHKTIHAFMIMYFLLFLYKDICVYSIVCIFFLFDLFESI